MTPALFGGGEEGVGCQRLRRRVGSWGVEIGRLCGTYPMTTICEGMVICSSLSLFLFLRCIIHRGVTRLRKSQLSNAAIEGEPGSRTGTRTHAERNREEEDDYYEGPSTLLSQSIVIFIYLGRLFLISHGELSSVVRFSATKSPTPVGPARSTRLGWRRLVETPGRKPVVFNIGATARSALRYTCRLVVSKMKYSIFSHLCMYKKARDMNTK